MPQLTLREKAKWIRKHPAFLYAFRPRGNPHHICYAIRGFGNTVTTITGTAFTYRYLHLPPIQQHDDPAGT